MQLLANCSTKESLALLEKYNFPKPRNKKELEFFLAKLYKEADDKKQIEKDFAEIHPHINFLKKYVLCEEKPKTDLVVESVASPIITTLPEPTSNCEGKCNCTKCTSNFDGNIEKQSINLSNDKILIFGMFGIISILALVIVNQKK